VGLCADWSCLRAATEMRIAWACTGHVFLHVRRRPFTPVVPSAQTDRPVPAFDHLDRDPAGLLRRARGGCRKGT